MMDSCAPKSIDCAKSFGRIESGLEYIKDEIREIKSEVKQVKELALTTNGRVNRLEQLESSDEKRIKDLETITNGMVLERAYGKGILAVVAIIGGIIGQVLWLVITKMLK